jgi:hypothetical protein
MAVQALDQRRSARAVRRSWRGPGLVVPLVAVLLSTLPAWFGAPVDLPAIGQKTIEAVVLKEAPTITVAYVPPLRPDTVDAADPEPGPPAPDVSAVLTTMSTVTRVARPMVAVVGVGAQGLVVRSAPGDGEKLFVADEGMDLRDLGDEREAYGRTWHHVRDADGDEGWVAADYLVSWDGLDRQARLAKLFARSAGVDPLAPRDRAWLDAPPDVRSITPDQLKDGQMLSSWDAYAACGPAAAVAFARATGHDLTLDEAVVAARKVGWNPSSGMRGPRSEVALLASLGIEAHQRGASEDEIDWDRVIGDVQAGLPVMIVTARHYYVAEKYDPATGKLDLGNSAEVLAGAHHERWFAPQQIGGIGYGTPFTTIHLGKAPTPTDHAVASTIVDDVIGQD